MQSFIAHHIITPWREAFGIELIMLWLSFQDYFSKAIFEQTEEESGKWRQHEREREEDNDNGTTRENAEDRTRVSASFEHAAGGGDVHVDVGLA